AGCSSSTDNSGYRVRTPTALAPAPAIQPTTGANVALSGQDTNGNPPGVPVADGPIESAPSGLRYIEQVPGDGRVPSTGQSVQVSYTGWLVDGTKFDTSDDHGGSFVFNLGQGQVIRGWDEGLATMREHGKRRLIL